MTYRIKYEDLTYLLEQVFGADWEKTYKLEKDILGYALFIKQERGCVSLFSSESRRIAPREMYYYLRGLLDMKNFAKDKMLTT